MRFTSSRRSPVSYTHLDVYKRQVVMCAICVVVNLVVTALPAKYTSIDCSATKLYSLTNDTKDRVSTVSYTHLDVYKRQE